MSGKIFFSIGKLCYFSLHWLDVFCHREKCMVILTFWSEAFKGETSFDILESLWRRPGSNLFLEGLPSLKHSDKFFSFFLFTLPHMIRSILAFLLLRFILEIWDVRRMMCRRHTHLLCFHKVFTLISNFYLTINSIACWNNFFSVLLQTRRIPGLPDRRCNRGESKLHLLMLQIIFTFISYCRSPVEAIVFERECLTLDRVSE